MNWQPIETAPKDGTRILAYSPNQYPTADKPSFIWVVEWDTRDTDGGAWLESGVEWYLEMEPTHWMPLPEPPQA